MANNNSKQYIVLFGGSDRKVKFAWKGQFPHGDVTDINAYFKAIKYIRHPQKEGTTFVDKKTGKTVTLPVGLGLRYEMKEQGVTAARFYEWDGKSNPTANDNIDTPPNEQSAEFLAVCKAVEDWKKGRDAMKPKASKKAAPAKTAAAKTAAKKQVAVAASKSAPAPSPLADPGFAGFLSSLYETWKAKQAAKA